MTEDSQERARSYGPFEEGAEPTAARPADTPPGDQRARGSQLSPGDSFGGDATSAYPASAAPYPGSETDPYGMAAPTGAGPYSAPAGPYSAPAGPYGGDPPGGNPYAYGPFHSEAQPADPYGLPQTGRRIEPSPPPAPRGLVTGILAGLLVGLLLFGAGGWFLGRATAPDAAPPGAPQAGRGLGVFEQSQVAINRPFFAGTGLAGMAEGWLPYLSTCLRSGRPGGPRPGPGEKVRVRCTLDGMGANFVEYASVAERDKARAEILEQSGDARKLAPGAAAATKRASPSGRVSGNYVEYAYKVDDDGTDRVVSAVWWDDAQTPIAAYLLAFWKEGVGERWEPMRDLWSRYA